MTLFFTAHQLMKPVILQKCQMVVVPSDAQIPVETKQGFDSTESENENPERGRLWICNFKHVHVAADQIHLCLQKALYCW